MLLRRLRADDAAGIQERKREILAVFQSIADPYRGALEQRMALRAPDDELVQLIYHRLAEPTSRALFEALAGSAVPMPSATDSVTLPAFVGQLEADGLRIAPEEPIEVPADKPEPMLAWAEAEYAPPDESPGVSLAWTLSAPSGEKQAARGMWLPKTRLGTGFAHSVDEPGEHVLALDLFADGQLVGQVARGVSAEPAMDDDGRGDTDWSAILGEASSPLSEFGRVDAELGVRLRPEPHHGADTIEILPFGTYLYAERETEHGWCYVSTSSDPAGAREAAPAGLVGFVERQHIAVDPPEPAARLHWVESGEMLKDIAATYYKGEAGFSWGQDARLFVEAIWKANEGRRSGITREEVELSWLDRRLRSEAGEENQRIWQGVQVRADHAIWIPSAAFVKSLKDQGAIDSGSITHGAWEAAKEVAEDVVDFAKYAAGFPLGVVQGAYESVRDLLVGVVNIAKFVGSFVKSIIQEGLVDACVELGKNVRDAVKAAPEILKSLGAWFVENWNNPEAFARGRFHGRVIGYVLVEVLLALISAGAITAAKVGAKFGSLAANFIRAARAVDSAIDPVAHVAAIRQRVKLPKEVADSIPTQSRQNTRSAESDGATGGGGRPRGQQDIDETRTIRELESSAGLSARRSEADSFSSQRRAYQGLRDASEYLQRSGVSRTKRIQILESFEMSTIRVETAGSDLYGLRFHGGGARPMGQFLTETFTPLTNRANLALPRRWNAMTGIQQWQVKPGTIVIRGRVGAQPSEGARFVGGADQIFVLEPWKHGSLQ